MGIRQHTVSWKSNWVAWFVGYAVSCVYYSAHCNHWGIPSSHYIWTKHEFMRLLLPSVITGIYNAFGKYSDLLVFSTFCGNSCALVHWRSPSNLTELERICREEWEKLPKYWCAKRVYPRRLKAVIAAKGASKKYWVNGLNTYVNVIFQFFILNKLANIM